MFGKTGKKEKDIPMSTKYFWNQVMSNNLIPKILVLKLFNTEIIKYKFLNIK